MRALFSRTLWAVLLAAVLALVGCSAEDVAKKVAKDQGVDIGVGELPDGYPEAVPVPKLPIESGAGTEGTYTLRFTSTDAVGDIAAYTDQLKAAGFKIQDEFDYSAKESHNVGVTGVGKGFRVDAVAFTEDAPGDGGYLGLVVMPK